MTDEIYTKLTRDDNINENSTILHDILQYVDDSNNIIITDNIDEIQPYINNYIKLIKSFYNINKLKINRDKSKVIIQTI